MSSPKLGRDRALKSAMREFDQAYDAMIDSWTNVRSEYKKFFGKSLSKEARKKPKKAVGRHADLESETDELADDDDDNNDGSSRASGSGQQSKKKKKGKQAAARKKRDPNAPKPPPSGYLRYRSSVYQATRDKYKDLSMQDVTRRIATQWGQMSEREKAPFNDEYKRAQAVWKADMAKYNKGKGKQGKVQHAVPSTSSGSPRTLVDPEEEEDEIDSDEDEIDHDDDSGEGEEEEEEEEEEVDPYDELEEKKRRREEKRSAARNAFDDSADDDDIAQEEDRANKKSRK
ncbi:hypothetical protein JCM3766R1_003849 [Sporobolomyces carnicolor]